MIPATFAGGVAGQVRVIWPSPTDNSAVVKPGTYIVSGLVPGTNFQPKATVIIKVPVGITTPPARLVEPFPLDRVVLDKNIQGQDTPFIKNRDKFLKGLIASDPNSFLYNGNTITYDAKRGAYTNLNLVQTYTVRKITRDAKGRTSVRTLGRNLLTPPNNVGPRSTPNYESLVAPAIQSVKDGTKVFAGQRDDPFYVDLGGTFDLLGFRSAPPGAFSAGGVDGLKGYSVAVHDIDAASAFYQSFVSARPIYEQDRPGVMARAIGLQVSDEVVELITPTGDGPLQRHLHRYGDGIRSTNFGCRDIGRLRRYFAERGVAPVEGDAPGSLAVPAEANLGAIFQFSE